MSVAELYGWSNEVLDAAILEHLQGEALWKDQLVFRLGASERLVGNALRRLRRKGKITRLTGPWQLAR